MIWAFLTGIFIITLIVVIELIWLGYQIVKGKEQGLTNFESKLAISAGIFILIVAVIILLGHKTSISWLYRNPIFYLPFRFAIVYLIGIPIFLAAKSSTRINDKTAWKKVIIYGLIITIISIISLIKYPQLSIAILIIYPLAFQAMFGVLPAVYHNPIQFLLPFVIAIGIHLYFYNTRYLKSFKLKNILVRIPAYIIGIAFLLTIFTAPIIFLPPTNYDWFRDYLNQKYGVAIKYENLSRLPQPLHIVNDIKPPTGLICKYLVFGEHAVDYSAMTD